MAINDVDRGHSNDSWGHDDHPQDAIPAKQRSPNDVRSKGAYGFSRV